MADRPGRARRARQAPASSGRHAPLDAPAPQWADTLIAGTLMAACVALHIAAMFPQYTGRPPTAVVASPDETAIYICLEAGWALAALLVLSRTSVRGGVALGAGLGAVEVGLLMTDTAILLRGSNGSAPGLWLALAALGAGLAGVLFGASAVPMRAPRGAPTPSDNIRAFLTVLVAVVAIAAFWPSWDHYHLVGTAGRVLDLTEGNAFAQPATIMAGELVAGLAIGIVAIVAAFWSPPAVGAWATGGVVIALTSQLVSGVVQVHEPLSETIGNTSGVNVAASGLWLTASWTTDLLAAIALTALAIWAGVEGRLAPADRGRQPGDPAVEEEWPAGHRWPAA